MFALFALLGYFILPALIAYSIHPILMYIYFLVVGLGIWAMSPPNKTPPK